MIYLYTIVGCPYCEASIELVKKMNLPYKEIIVLDKERNKYKKKHEMQTFPQIFFKNSKGNMIKLGGCEDLRSIIELCSSRNK